MKSILYPVSLLLVASVTGLFADEKAEVMALGQTKYILCGACHGMDGKGMAPVPTMKMAPGYTDSPIVKHESSEAMALAVMKGIAKEDNTYINIMAPLEAALPDADLAAVLTYVRAKFGDRDDIVTVEQVKGWRAKYADRTAPVTRKELEEMVSGEAK